MKKRATRSRLQQTFFNCLLILLMAGVLYIGDGLPPLTKNMLKNDVLRDNLMAEGEIIWEDRNWQNYRRMYILCGDTVVSASYRWNLFAYSRWDSYILYGNDGVTCVPSGTPGELLVMGNLPEAASAILELQMRGSRWGEIDRVYTAEGERESNKVISFALPEIYEDDREFFADSLRKTVYPEGYYDYTLRLYDAAGQEIGVWTDIPEEEA